MCATCKKSSHKRSVSALFYFLYKNGCQGYLRWAFDAFTDEPLVDTMHWTFCAGDQNLIYPDSLEDNDPTVRSSVRYQVMMEAYKKICALETLKGMSADAKNKVDTLVNKYQGYSSTVLKNVNAMNNSIFELANNIINGK